MSKVRRMPCLIMFFSLLVSCDVWSAFYISKEGKDTNNATASNPLKSIEEALKRIRKLRNSNIITKDSATIIFTEGFYHIHNTINILKKDSGTNEIPLIIKAKKGHKVLLSGSTSLKNIAEVISRDAGVLDERVKIFDLKNISRFANLPEFSLEEGSSLKPGPTELFVGVDRMQIARWPNQNWALVKNVQRDKKYAKKITLLLGKRVKNWKADNIWLLGFWKHNWINNAQLILGVDEALESVSIKNTHKYGYKKNSRYIVLNALSELDMPEEYFIDFENQLLYFWPPDQFNKEDMYFSSNNSSLLKITDASNVSIKGIEFSHSRVNGVFIENGKSIELNNLKFTGIRNTAIKINGGKYNLVKNCKLEDIGVGIDINSGNRKSLEPANHIVENVTIKDYGNLYFTKRPGISINGVGITIRNNQLVNGPHKAIRIIGNNHLIESNIITSFCMETSDCGAIYTGRDWYARGSMIRKNKILGHESRKDNDVTGIYLDDMASGISVYDNVIRNVHRGILIGGGRSNYIADNKIHENDIPLHLDARGVYKKDKKSIQGLYKYNKKLKTMFIDSNKSKNIWLISYQNIGNLFDDEPLKPKYNIIKNNHFINCGEYFIHPAAKLYSPF